MWQHLSLRKKGVGKIGKNSKDTLHSQKCNTKGQEATIQSSNKENSRIIRVNHWNRLPRLVTEPSFKVSLALSRGLNCELLSQECSKLNYPLSLHMPLVNLGPYIYVKVLNEKNTQFQNVLGLLCGLTRNICVCGAILK